LVGAGLGTGVEGTAKVRAVVGEGVVKGLASGGGVIDSGWAQAAKIPINRLSRPTVRGCFMATLDWLIADLVLPLPRAA